MRSLRYLKNREKPLFDTNNTPNLTLTPINHIGVSTISVNSVLRVTGLPNSPIGLTEGDVWRDDNGFLRIVWFCKCFLVELNYGKNTNNRW